MSQPDRPFGRETPRAQGPLDDLGRSLGQVESPSARDAFRASLRERLLASAAGEWAPARRVQPAVFSFFGPRLAPRYALAAGLALAVALGAGGAAAASSLPGDAAYPLKLAFEQVELATAVSQETKIDVLARQGQRRLDELTRVAASRPQSAPTASESYQATVERFSQAVDALQAAPPDEKRDAALDVAEVAAAKHVEVLEAIRGRSDAPGIARALERAKDLQERAKHDGKKKDKQKGGERPAGAPGATDASSAQPASTARPTETPKSRETPKPSETPKASGDD